MTKVNSALSERFKNPGSSRKMEELARRSSSGNLSSFSGVFKTTPLSESEKQLIEEIILSHQQDGQEIGQDIVDLLGITSEVKAINNQAIILHGERIKKAQTLLKRYRDGAFTSWLVLTYGNRQTPYNFLQYYEFYRTLKDALREKLCDMPKQAIYTLASRDGSLKEKETFIENYQGEPKQVLLEKIRSAFPLRLGDKRAQNPSETITSQLEKLLEATQHPRFAPSRKEKMKITSLLSQIRKQLFSLPS